MFGRNRGHVLQPVVSWATYILIFFSSSAPWRFICLVFTLYFISWVKLGREEREREREREEDYNVKNREKMTMEINVGRPCWIKICFVSFLDIKFQDTAADSKFHIFVWLYENEKSVIVTYIWILIFELLERYISISNVKRNIQIWSQV